MVYETEIKFNLRKLDRSRHMEHPGGAQYSTTCRYNRVVTMCDFEIFVHKIFQLHTFLESMYLHSGKH